MKKDLDITKEKEEVRLESKKAKYTGCEQSIKVWKTSRKSRFIELIYGETFEIGHWSAMETESHSVLTSEGEFICDMNSTFFSQYFVLI